MTPSTPGEKIVNLEARMQAVERVIYQFEAYQKAVQTFMDSHEATERERERTDKRRSTIHFALLGGLITLVAGLAIALFTWIINGHHVVVQYTDKPTVAQFNAAVPKMR